MAFEAFSSQLLSRLAESPQSPDPIVAIGGIAGALAGALLGFRFARNITKEMGPINGCLTGCLAVPFLTMITGVLGMATTYGIESLVKQFIH